MFTSAIPFPSDAYTALHKLVVSHPKIFVDENDDFNVLECDPVCSGAWGLKQDQHAEVTVRAG